MRNHEIVGAALDELEDSDVFGSASCGGWSLLKF